jgi:hypothetical protein
MQEKACAKGLLFVRLRSARLPDRCKSRGELDDEADYRLTCPFCRTALELQAPEDLDQWTLPGPEHATAPPVVRLT